LYFRGVDRATVAVRGQTLLVRQFAVSVVDGADRGTRVVSASEELSIGTAEGNDLRLGDHAVSRHHCTLRAVERGLQLVDLGSRNGTFIGDVEITSCYVKSGVQIRIGQTTVAVHVLDTDLEQPIASEERLGPLLGASAAMRRLYPLVEQCAKSNATVLVVGETGTGKELIAEAIHELSGRAGPFVVVDCSALSHDLAESELFGHEKGAFTGANATRIGAFENADGGTIFLDEIGELPLALQPLLLRVLEARSIRRIGSNDYRPVDVRVVAASHRDLRGEVNEKRFRADLFYRLNVLRIVVPPLRERAGDIPLLVEHFWRMFRPDTAPAALVQHLAAQSWPGNIRELRNAVERAAVIGWAPPSRVPEATPAPTQATYQQAKEQAIAEWERVWVERLVNGAGGNLSRAARAAKMGRSHLRELARKHGVQTRASTAQIDASDGTDEED
jgi:transcriptional regulator with GAF, ATPase, and Fis domain